MGTGGHGVCQSGLIPSGIRRGSASERPGGECKQACVYRVEICTASALPQLLLTWDTVGKAGKNNLLHPQQLQLREKAATGEQWAAPGAVTQPRR